MKIVCKCLNVKIEVENFLDLQLVNLSLTPEEKCHLYFQEDVYKIPGNVSSVTEVFTKHVRNEIVGSWNICKCLMCKIYTHGTNYITGLTTCSSYLKEVPVDLKSYGQQENISYSQVFHICFPRRLNIPENYSSDEILSEILDKEYIEDISKKASSFLELAETKIKNSSTSVNLQDQAMEALRRRVKCEERYLHLLMVNEGYSQESILPTGSSSFFLQSSGLEYEDNFPYMVSDVVRPLHFPKVSSFTLNDPDVSMSSENIQKQAPVVSNFSNNGRPSFSTDCDKLQSDFSNLYISPSLEKKQKEESLLDMSEGIFEMDDFVSPNAASKYIPEEEKESDDDVFPEFSEEELNASRGISAKDLAKSVPLNVPAWPCDIDRHDRGMDTKRPKDPQEIAASMRELARSVRTSSVDVFGELPRPNFAGTTEFLP